MCECERSATVNDIDFIIGETFSNRTVRSKGSSAGNSLAIYTFLLMIHAHWYNEFWVQWCIFFLSYTFICIWYLFILYYELCIGLLWCGRKIFSWYLLSSPSNSSLPILLHLLNRERCDSWEWVWERESSFPYSSSNSIFISRSSHHSILFLFLLPPSSPFQLSATSIISIGQVIKCALRVLTTRQELITMNLFLEWRLISSLLPLPPLHSPFLPFSLLHTRLSVSIDDKWIVSSNALVPPPLSFHSSSFRIFFFLLLSNRYFIDHPSILILSIIKGTSLRISLSDKRHFSLRCHWNNQVYPISSSSFSILFSLILFFSLSRLP